MSARPTLLVSKAILIGIPLLLVGVVVAKLVAARGRAIRVAAAPASSAPPAPPPASPPPPPPVDAAALAAAVARFGGLDAWQVTDEPCPHELPQPGTLVWRRPSKIGLADEVAVPPPPMPTTTTDEVDRALVALAAPVDAPSLVVLETLHVAPVKTNSRMFTPGRVEGRVFLRVPGDDGIACAGSFAAASSEMLDGDNARTPDAELQNELAVHVDLLLRTRRAAIDSLRLARRRP